MSASPNKVSFNNSKTNKAIKNIENKTIDSKENNKRNMRIYFEIPDLYFNPINSKKILTNLVNTLSFTHYTKSILYSIEGIIELDEKNNKLYQIELVDNETEKIVMDPYGEKLTVFCDYSTIDKKEVYKFPYSYIKTNIEHYVFQTVNRSSLKLVVEKNTQNNEIIDVYCILEKNCSLNDNPIFYKEIKEFNNLILNV